MANGNDLNNKCLNCGAALTGGFCAQCGQKNIDLNLSIGHIIGEFLGDIFSYDSRVFRTLVPLLFKPGFLTAQYNLGRRVSYVPPVRLFIIISLLYFFSLTLTGFQGGNIVITNDNQANVTAPAGSSEEGEVVTPGNIMEQPPVTTDDDAGDKSPLVNSFVRKVLAAGQNRDLILAKMADWMPRLMFVLIPVFAFILKMCYWKSGRYYIHHLIFSLHYHSFLFLLLFFLLPLAAFNDELADLISVIVMATYLLLGMRRVYAEHIGRTIIKFMFLSASYLCVFGVTTLSLFIAIIMLQD